MPAQSVTVGELTFDVQVQGPDDGAAVLLLHGFPQSSACFDAVVPRLHSAGLRTIAPDQRGYSPGARPAGIEAYGVRELVADAIGLLDALGIGYAHVVGHDWGAAVAWQLAARHPDRVASLVAASVGHPVAFSAALRTDPDQRARSGYMREFFDSGTEDRLLADDGAQLREMVTHGDVAPELLRRPGLSAALSWYRAMTAADHQEVVDVEVPTTFLWSTGDHALGRTQAIGTARHVRGEYRYVELRGVSHWIPDEAPAALASEVALRSSSW
ncbi:MAG: alpha/beta hydrolase [Mycobacteriaceae bacterium]